MRRLHRSLLAAALTKPLCRHRPPPPLLHRSPLRPHQSLPFSTRALTTPLPSSAAAPTALTTPPPTPNAAPTSQPTALASLEAAERKEAAGDHQEALDLALKALAPLQETHGGWSLPVARALRLAGAAAFRLNLLNDSLDSLEAAAEIVDSLLGAGAEAATVGAAVLDQLARTKTAMGRRWDAVADLRRALELKGRVLDGGCADACRDVAEAYVGVLCFDKALPLCLSALEITVKRFGDGSAEVAKVRQILMVAYTGLGRNEEALEQNKLLRMVYEGLGMDVELSLAEIDGAGLSILLGRTEDAMNDLKKVMNRASKDSEERALAFVTMAKILCSQERLSDSRRCLEIARETLDSKRSANPERTAGAYTEISMLYESMTEFEMSLCLMRKTLAFLERVSGMQHIQGSISARLGWLLLLTKRVDEAVPLLEKAVEKLKNCFGPLHFGLGFAYKHLGEANLELNQLDAAVKFFVLASDIITAAFGPKHEDSIEILQLIANAYGLMGSYKHAEDYQLRVIAAYESCGPDMSYEQREARRLLEQLRKKAEGSPHAVFPANSLPVLPQDRE
ncbi:nephrocystin-3-like [Lolium rigidum]|uniref:nephrocystin-3-like n=1 Tax=Lolium rigidum TaxID=89674 RepID=UPI001F5C1BE1|nr:nephrocystin-3-like [Lolium rigidum]XP_047089473.1 nephrocystin-3-like [Lolium rigidum]